MSNGLYEFKARKVLQKYKYHFYHKLYINLKFNVYNQYMELVVKKIKELLK